MKLSTLGLMKKVGCIVCGFDAVGREIKDPSSKICGVAVASDLSAKTLKELHYLKDKFRPELQIVELQADMKQIESVIGKKTGIIAVTDEGFWKSLAKKEERQLLP